jgi:hypothetical protein
MNDEATEMTAIRNSAVSALQSADHGDQAAAHPPSHHILIARRIHKIYKLRQIQIGPTASGPEVMPLLKQALSWQYRYGPFLFKPEIETAQLVGKP